MQRSRSRIALLATIFFIVGLSVVVLWLVLPSEETSDTEQIRELVRVASAAFNDRDWEELAELSWPVNKRDALQEELEGYAFLRGVLVEEPVSVSNLVVQEGVATCTLSVEGKFVIGRARWGREFTATFRKHQNKWYVDSEPTRDAVNDAR